MTEILRITSQSDVSDWADWAARGNSSYTSPTILTAATRPWMYPFWRLTGYMYYCGAELLLYPTWVLHTFLTSKPIAQLAVSRYPSDIAIESDHLAF
eukprot:2504713-Pleurochrysis_carterae.AAC.1